MLIFKKTNETIEFRRQQMNISIGFVPTMGALHEGHLNLVKISLKENDFTYVSIFVNPLQFNDKKDLEKYPKNTDRDIKLLESIGTNALFLPSFEEVYNSSVQYDEINLDDWNSILEGQKRQGHFEGVIKAVSILFKIIMPHRAYFGLKDYQQVKIIEQLVIDKGYPIEIVSCSTVREQDGLAMSSRNAVLSPDAKKSAPKIYQWLLKAKKMYHSGRSVEEIKATIIREINDEKHFQLDYFEIRDAHDLSEIKSREQKTVALIAVFLDGIRLIDNIELT